MRKKLKVSLIVPIYNCEEFLDECISSIINQAYENLEIILVNDGSTDNSLNIIEKYSKEDLRIKVINKKNGGLSSARNAGIDISTGDYLMHVDGDDFIEKDAVLKMIEKIFELNEKVDVVIGDLKFYSEANYEKIWKDSDLNENKIYTGKYYLEKYFFLGKACYSSCNKLWKRELYIKNNIRHPIEISLGEDSNTVVRLMFNAKNITKINSSIYNYRVNLNSMTNSKNKKILDYKKSIEILEKYFLDKNISEFFKEYKLCYTFFTFYDDIRFVTKEEIKEKYKNNKDYSTAKKLFEKDIKKINKDKYIMENISFEKKFLMTMYNFNFELTDILISFLKKIKYKIKL